MHLFNDLFLGNLLMCVDTGEDLRKLLERKNLLDKEEGIKMLMEILHSIEKTSLATKLWKCLVIG